MEQKERKKKWDEKNQEAIAEAVKQLEEFDKVVPTNSLFYYLIVCNFLLLWCLTNFLTSEAHKG